MVLHSNCTRQHGKKKNPIGSQQIQCFDWTCQNFATFCCLFLFASFFAFFVLFISHNFDRVSLHRLLVILGINRGEKRVHIKASIKYGLNPFKTSYNNKGFEYLKSKLIRKKCACNQCTQKKMHLKWDVDLSTSKQNQMRSIVGRYCIEMDIEMKVRSNRSKCTLYNVQACLCSFIAPYMVRLWIHKKFYSMKIVEMRKKNPEEFSWTQPFVLNERENRATVRERSRVHTEQITA